MVTPLGWENYFGFVCTPRHRTYHNAKREGAFTVSYPRPRQVVLASLAAGPRCDDGSKPSLGSLDTFPAVEVDGVFIEEAFFFLECTLHQVIDGFGENSLVAGRIVAAHIDPAALRMHDRDDSDVVHGAPLLAYLDPGRFARIEKSFSFPFMADYKK
jgi:flavin reductase (DIM6/NTAB) family NADH-FMN oxidoreductase RutF